MHRPIRVTAAAGLAAWLALSAAGCGGQKYGEIKGKVTFDGKPLPAGLVVFTNDADNLMASAYLKADGTFHAKQVPAGKVRAVVKNDEFKNQIDEKTVKMLQKKGVPIVMPDSSEKGNKYVPIPAKYADRDQSGLSYEVKPEGVTEITIDLAK